MDYHIILILAEVLDRVALTEVAVKVGIVNFLKNSHPNISSEKGELDASVVMSKSLP